MWLEWLFSSPVKILLHLPPKPKIVFLPSKVLKSKPNPSEGSILNFMFWAKKETYWLNWAKISSLLTWSFYRKSESFFWLGNLTNIIFTFCRQGRNCVKNKWTSTCQKDSYVRTERFQCWAKWESRIWTCKCKVWLHNSSTLRLRSKTTQLSTTNSKKFYQKTSFTAFTNFKWSAVWIWLITSKPCRHHSSPVASYT